MKRFLVGMLGLILIIFVLPLLILKSCQSEVPDKPDLDALESIKISVYNVTDNKLEEMNLEEYVVGVLAGEMPSEFHIEALKAQALAARTYTLMRVKAFGGEGCAKHPEADICTDPAHCQAYRAPATIKVNLDKYKQAVTATKGDVIVYNDALIDAVFHSTSGGKTENSEEVWSAKVPYLRSVVSEYEEHSPKLITQKEVKTTDFIAAMKKLDSSLKLNAKTIKNQIKILDRSEGGRITSIQIGDKMFSGSAIRGALGLNSSNFNISYQGSTMLFTVTGNGHGIGLSQYGADGMGKQGFSYEDIIKHYYTGVEIISSDELVKLEKQNIYNASK